VAAKSLLGNAFRVTERRGALLQSDLAPVVVATVHPSAVLRAPGDRARRRERQAFTNDLRVAAEAMRGR
jgi:DNA polymerase